MATPGWQVVSFFVLSCLISWPLWLYNAYCNKTSSCEEIPFLIQLGSVGPLLAAMLLTFSTSGFHGVKSFFESSYKYDKKNWRWIILSFMLPIIIMITSGFLFQIFGGGPETHFEPIEFLTAFIAGIMIFPMEETGWRGFALPRLFQALQPPAPLPDQPPQANQEKPVPVTRGVKGAPTRPPRPPVRKQQSKAESIIIPSMVLGTMAACFKLPLFLFSAPYVPLDTSMKGISQELTYYITGLDLLSIIITVIWLRCNRTTTAAVIFSSCMQAAMIAMQTTHVGKLFSYVAITSIPVAAVLIQGAPAVH